MMSRKIDFLPAGTRTPQGLVIHHDRTVYELGRLCIETPDSYPDLLPWLKALDQYGMIVKLYQYKEKPGRIGTAGYLWLFYVSPKRIERTSWDDPAKGRGASRRKV